MSECCGRPTSVPPPDWDTLEPSHTVGDSQSVQSTVFWLPGTGPLVLAVPHGGTLRPSAVPDRTSGCVEPDTHTAQLALVVRRRALRLSPSLSPALVVGKLHRVKVDLARPRAAAAEGDAGRAAWDEYHAAVRVALDGALKRHGRAHLVDLHGQCHRDASEVGYMLTNAELRRVGRLETDGADDGGGSSSSGHGAKGGGATDELLGRSSLSAMVNLEPYAGLDDIIRGPHSIGTLLERAGYAAVPSFEAPHPCCRDCTTVCSTCCDANERDWNDGASCCMKGAGSGAATCCNACQPCTGFDVKRWCGAKPNGCRFGPCSYFWGGYACMTYGGGRTDPASGESTQIPRYRGSIAATQIETQWRGCRETEGRIERFGEALAGAIVGFAEHFYLDGTIL